LSKLYARSHKKYRAKAEHSLKEGISDGFQA